MLAKPCSTIGTYRSQNNGKILLKEVKRNDNSRQKPYTLSLNMTDKNSLPASKSSLELNIVEITEFHRECLKETDWLTRTNHGNSRENLWGAITENHKNNSLLWAEEDLARRRLASDSEIAANKRNIDRFNQARNDAIEAIDEHLLAQILQSNPSAKTGQINSESAGSIVDRLSILSLKKRAFSKQIERIDVDSHHIKTCQSKLLRLSDQEQDLTTCFASLMADAEKGIIRWKIYRQFKMYNDPRLNPQIYLES